MLINLWVRDKSNGQIHQVGTDVHDSIEFICGQVHYYNLQNGCGTLDEYEWVVTPDIDDYVSLHPTNHSSDDLISRKALLEQIDQ